MVIPFMVDDRGKFISYDVRHDNVAKRWKRDTTDPTKAQLFYNITVFGKQFNFNLRINQRLYSRRYSVEVWGQNGSRRQTNAWLNCHYTGQSEYPAVSTAAISNCYGLHGVFQTSDEDIFVEPLWNHTVSNVETFGHPHIVYKSTDIKVASDDGQCGVLDFEKFKAQGYLNEPGKDGTNYKRIKRVKNSGTQSGHFYHNSNQIFPKIRHGRYKRSMISEEINVETLVVADKKMVEYHGKQIIESYVLSIMNIVSQVAKLFHDGSIGNAVNIVVSRLAILEKDQQNLTLNHHAGTSLDSFCTWQYLLNITADEMGTAHHDNAVLLTGYDICTYKNQPCGTLGLAPVGDIFGMQHDGAENPCGTPGSNEPAGIMAAKLTKGTRPFTWSSCSRAYLTEFLESGKGVCLVNKPSEYLVVKPQLSNLPKEKSDADEQCKLQFGETSRMCKPQEVCQQLWCFNNDGRCITNSIPAADGTECNIQNYAENGWCYRGQCRPLDYQPEPQNGHWGEWSSWNECTRSCGGGVESSYRKCNNPPFTYGLLNIMCPHNTKDFRELQCADYNDKPFKGRFYHWKPFTGAQDRPCALNCIAVGYNFYTERARKVIDGTRCYPDKMDMCINGKCLPVGCDGILESSAREDKCRVCNGNSTTCQTISGTFDRNLPKGTIKSNRTGNYYINGDWTIDWPRKFSVGGTVFDYQRISNRPEKLQALGPITEDLVVMVLLQEDNLGIYYEYNIPNRRKVSNAICVDKTDFTTVSNDLCAPQPKPSIQTSECNTQPCPPLWSAGSWSQCSATCGRGRKVRTVICIQTLTQREQIILPEEECTDRRPVSVRRCRLVDCPSSWYTESWSEGKNNMPMSSYDTCNMVQRKIMNDFISQNSSYNDLCSTRCGRGIKTRNVYCMTSDRQTYLAEDQCDLRSKPLATQPCFQRHCPTPQWNTEEWGVCSVTCGRGRQERRVLCQTYTGQISNNCNIATKPITLKECEIVCEQPSRSRDCTDQDKAQFCPLVVKFGYCHRDYFL
ncbi:hypothetical protein KUTeg_017084 [Tegillarca granosa]|uniref:Peptidase M12B domain-containing protein n=1 Tax=Tegillarca granosa TaxID=220873 RepID=A0ABQ9ENL4_TEGGR|nr:hypothetical protein KUTeg_017084 [Tegillarca granosa]